MNPAGKLPVLVDDGKVITESIAIVLYLAEKYPEANLLPTDIQQRAQVLRWLMFTATELEQPLWRMALHSTLYPEAKRSPREIEVAADDFAAMAQVAERHMAGREFVVGDRVSVADFVLAYTLDWANEVRVLGSYPGVHAYMERMYARPHAPVRIAEALASVRQ